MFRDLLNDFRAMSLAKPYAVVIEPRLDLAEVIADALRQFGFVVATADTHIGAARVSEGRCPQVLIACVPADAEDFPGAYLEECREALGSLPTVLLLAEEAASTECAPDDAVRLSKPFTRGELLLAVDEALAMNYGALLD
jgi:DNA-binding response OmpR family regulator